MNTLVDNNYQDHEWDMSNGSVEIFVTKHIGTGKDKVFEYDIISYTGNAYWLDESYGIDNWIADMDDELDECKAGYTYILSDIALFSTIGDGWESDDTNDWYWGELVEVWRPLAWLKQKINNAWCTVVY